MIFEGLSLLVMERMLKHYSKMSQMMLFYSSKRRCGASIHQLGVD